MSRLLQILKNGEAWCWGDNADGRRGNGGCCSQMPVDRAVELTYDGLVGDAAAYTSVDGNQCSCPYNVGSPTRTITHSSYRQFQDQVNWCPAKPECDWLTGTNCATRPGYDLEFTATKVQLSKPAVELDVQETSCALLDDGSVEWCDSPSCKGRHDLHA